MNSIQSDQDQSVSQDESELEPILQEMGIKLLQFRVGEGGSAYIHRAEIEKIVEGVDNLGLEVGTPIAVKDFKPSALAISGQLDRIAQEINVGRGLKHDNLVKVYGGRIDGDGRCLLFMQWFGGKTLERWSEELRRNCAWSKLRSVAIDLIAAVRALHGQNILHRDIKPENVMIQNERAILMDIGVAEITEDGEFTMHTAVKDFVGSLRYASPQFILGEGFTEKDDVYGIGATLSELFSGIKPYADVERKSVLPIVAVQNPPKVAELRENIPSSVKIVLEGCLQRSRNNRPSLDELEDALTRGGDSPYVKAEIQRASETNNYYPVLRVESGGAGFYADLRTASPPEYTTYTVVRKGPGLLVPSLGAEVEP